MSYLRLYLPKILMSQIIKHSCSDARRGFYLCVLGFSNLYHALGRCRRRLFVPSTLFGDEPKRSSSSPFSKAPLASGVPFLSVLTGAIPILSIT
mmetsp:Transcript_18128/g.37464  ORF Transcript_18128/g.37464 Transcript_18128/m.37464 type:complete len:94 (+) Transcript_18128:255-536(+)